MTNQYERFYWIYTSVRPYKLDEPFKYNCLSGGKTYIPYRILLHVVGVLYYLLGSLVIVSLSVTLKI